LRDNAPERCPCFVKTYFRATKTKITDRVPLSPESMDILKRRRAAAVDSCAYVFPGIDGKKPLTTFRWAWTKICKAAGLGQEYEVIGRRGKPLKRWRPAFEDGTRLRRYDLRHTFASTLVNDGVTLQVVGENLGHVKLSATMKYTHLADAAQRPATDAIGSKFSGLAGNRAQPAKGGLSFPELARG
jgi:integrase